MDGAEAQPSHVIGEDGSTPTTQSETAALANRQSPEATLTSFAPFVTPRRDLDTLSTDAGANNASLVDSRPPRNNVRETEASAHKPTQHVNVKRDLLEDIIAPTRDDDPLFTDRDVDFYRQHPVALEEADHATLARLIKRYPLARLLKTFGRDMARKDAELTDMRRRLEDMASLFKDHLTAVHGLSRVEADKTLHNMSTQLYNQDDLYSSLENAANSPIETASAATVTTPVSSRKASNVSVASSHRSSRATPSMPPPPPPSTAIRQVKHSKSILSMFGGRVSTPKSITKTEPRRPRAGTSSSNPYNPNVLNERTRGSSISSISASASTSLSEAGPVELNAIVDSEELPPLLMTPREVEAHYPEHSADVYGFILDSSRVDDYIAHSEAMKTRSGTNGHGVDTPVGTLDDVDATHGLSNVDQDMVSWTSYLKLDTAAIGTLSWLPIASPKQATQVAGLQEVAFDQQPRQAESNRRRIMQALRDQVSSEHTKLQRDRTIPWERFMTFDSQPKEQPYTPFLSALLKRQTPSTARHLRSASDSVPGMPTDMSKDTRIERTKLIMAGVPMHLRAKVWSQYVNEFMMHEPGEYGQLVKQSEHSLLGNPALAEIADDIPRTLTNNVYFRSGKGRAALQELLRAYVVKKPEIGYCQGMNLIGGYLLLALPSTETAFWIFCYMIEHVLAETYFDATLRGASIEIAVLRSYVGDLIPALAKHMDDLDVAEPETVPYNWFLTAFASTLPIEDLYRVWDIVLALPTQKNWLLRLAIALLKANEEALLAIDDPFELRDFMDRKIGGPAISIDGLIKASSKLGLVMKEEDVRKRRRFYAFKIDEPRAGR